jgi:hypothetical protein
MFQSEFLKQRFINAKRKQAREAQAVAISEKLLAPNQLVLPAAKLSKPDDRA